jgi:hypothetical protein
MRLHAQLQKRYFYSWLSIVFAFLKFKQNNLIFKFILSLGAFLRIWVKALLLSVKAINPLGYLLTN